MESSKEFIAALTKILIQNKAIPEKDADLVIKEFEGYSKGAFDEFLLREGLVSKEDLLVALGQYYHVPAVDVRGYFFDPGLIRAFPEDLLLHYAVVPLEVDQSIMTVVAAQPNISGLAGKLEGYGTYVIEFRVGLYQYIIDIIREYHEEEIPIDEQHLDEDEARELIEEDDLNQFPDESI